MGKNVKVQILLSDYFEETANCMQMNIEEMSNCIDMELTEIIKYLYKEHPIMTNIEKYEQMMKNLLGNDFEIEICPSKSHDVLRCACDKMNDCNDCVKFWNSEYRKKEEE